eukprot:6186491-Pleurochrysis_carterae.AAC.3
MGHSVSAVLNRLVVAVHHVLQRQLLPSACAVAVQRSDRRPPQPHTRTPSAFRSRVRCTTSRVLQLQLTLACMPGFRSEVGLVSGKRHSSNRFSIQSHDRCELEHFLLREKSFARPVPVGQE